MCRTHHPASLGMRHRRLADRARGFFPGVLVRVEYRASSGHSKTMKERIRDLAANPTIDVHAIPKALHHVYMGGLDSLHKAEQIARPLVGQKFPGYNCTMRLPCPRIYHEWQYMFWNQSQAEDSIQASYTAS